MSVLKIKNTSTGTWEDIVTIKGETGEPGSISTDLKHALLQIAEKVYYIDGRGERYYQDLWNALYGADYVENFTRIGNPHIENGILTASADGYVTTLESFDPGSNPWELTVKLYRPRITGKYEKFFTSGGVAVRTACKSSTTSLILNSADSTFVNGQATVSIPAEQWVWIKAAFSGSIYDFGKSTDGFVYTWKGGGHTPFTGYIPSAMKTSTPIKAGVLSLLSGTGDEATVAKIDLRETEIKINGQVWWKPYLFE